MSRARERERERERIRSKRREKKRNARDESQDTPRSEHIYRLAASYTLYNSENTRDLNHEESLQYREKREKEKLIFKQLPPVLTVIKIRDNNSLLKEITFI